MKSENVNVLLSTSKFIEYINNNFDIVEVINFYTDNKLIHSSLNPDRYYSTCPFKDHKTENKGFYVSISNKHFRCFGCNRSGKILNFLIMIKDIDPKHICVAINLLKSDFPDKFKGYEFDTKQFEKIINNPDELDIFETNKECSLIYYKALNLPACKDKAKYLLKKGLTKNLIKEYMIGGVPDEFNFIEKMYDCFEDDIKPKITKNRMYDAGLINSRYNEAFFDRIIFPIQIKKYERFNYCNVVGFFAVDVDGKSQYEYIYSKNTKIFDPNRTLYNLNNVDLSINEMYIVSSVWDMFALKKLGIINVVCLMGKMFSFDHCSVLAKSKITKYIFCLEFNSEYYEKINLSKNILKNSIANVGVYELNDPIFKQDKHICEIINENIKDMMIDKIKNHKQI